MFRNGRQSRGIVDIAGMGMTGPERSRSQDEREPLDTVKPAGSGVTLKNSSSTLYKAWARVRASSQIRPEVRRPVPRIRRIAPEIK